MYKKYNFPSKRIQMNPDYKLALLMDIELNKIKKNV